MERVSRKPFSASTPAISQRIRRFECQLRGPQEWSLPPCGPGPARHRRRPRPRHPSDTGAGSGSPPVPAGRSSRYGPGPARVRPRGRTNGIPDRWSRARAAHWRRRVLGSRAPRVNGAAAAAPVPDPVSPPSFANLPRQVACGQAVPVDLRPFEEKADRAVRQVDQADISA